jgi:signal transduction histidine kinase/HPt (histidine-containing phosphotransfer) domain-containing protein
MSATTVPISDAEPLPPAENAIARREAASSSATPAAIRHYLSLPFAAVFASIAQYDSVSFWPVAILVAQITLAFLCDRHIRAHERMEARRWAIRYTLLSAAAGASWGAVAVLWFVAAPPATEALFVLACIGMSAMEFIARCRFPYGYAAHAALSLGALVVLLLLQATPYSFALAAVCICVSGSLALFGDTIANLIAESDKLRRDNIQLIAKLSKETREALQARDAAEASARAKSTFIANISHEIRTPLNAMLGMSQLLDRADLEKPNRDYVKVMLEAGRGLRTLLDDVITLARDDTITDSHNDSDPALAARAVAQLLQPHAWEKQLRLSVNAPSALPRVAADPRRVRQVLLKLTENALKFTDHGGVEITVSVHEPDDNIPAVHFSVSDTGLGIPPDVAETLFEPFMPGDASYARRHQGAGLGLAVAKRVVESLGGNIGFESEPGEGSTFWFTLPVAEAALPGAMADSDADTEVAPPSDLSLLIHTGKLKVDLALSRILETFGNRVIFAESRADAAARAARETFDVIIAGTGDVEMLAATPGMRAPLLAILFPNDRAPASGEQILHWPAAPRTVYAAIRDAATRKGPAEAPDRDSQETAPIDASAFAALEKSLGLSTLLEILQSYIKTAENLCEDLAEASAAGEWDEAGRVAQDIAGAAGGLGLAALTATARGFAQNVRNHEIEDAHALRNQAQLIVGEHARTRLALASLYPDLAA